MKKKKAYRILSIITSVLLISCSTLSVYGAEKEKSKKADADLVKTYKFSVEKSDDFSYSAPTEVQEKGKKYKLKDISYEVIKDNRIEVVKEVLSKDKEDYEKTIDYTLPSGKIIKLTAGDEMINWQEYTGEGIIRTKEYSSRNSIPQTITETRPDADGKPIEVTLELTNVENTSKSENFSAPAAFYSPSENGSRYSFNGKTVSVSTDSPTWSGYETDVKEYLGLSGSSYEINGGTWSDSATYDGTKYVRHATYSGVRTTPLFRATFTEKALYTADITYYAYHGKGKIKAVAEYDRVFGVKDAVMVGIAILIVAAAVALIFFTIGKRRKADK